MLRKPCRLQTDGRTDRQTDKVNPVYPPPTSLGGGIKKCKWYTCYFSANFLMPAKITDVKFPIRHSDFKSDKTDMPASFWEDCSFVFEPEKALFDIFGCLHLLQSSMTYLMTLSDWTMSCQPGSSHAHHGQCTRYKQTTWAYKILY